MNWPIFFALWFICGIVAYGMTKENLRRRFEEEELGRVGYDTLGEVVCLIFLLCGLAGILSALLVCFIEKEKPGLCFKMPAELKRGNNGRV